MITYYWLLINTMSNINVQHESQDDFLIYMYLIDVYFDLICFLKNKLELKLKGQ
jgi:hypothetical protein